MVTSPLRYPGGKAKLFPFFSSLIATNNFFTSEYYEPYAGGAGLAIRLLTTGFVKSISINDIDSSIYAFWTSALYRTREFCELVEKTPVNIDEWYRQKLIWKKGDLGDTLSLGFAAYFLNRTNRSGIIEGAGPIGGYAQSGKWTIDVRLVKDKQIENLLLLSKYAEQIKVTNVDALEFLRLAMKNKKSLVYLDPPYYVKGHKLYKNFYTHADHLEISEFLGERRKSRWVVSYDDVPEIRTLYNSFSPINYSLGYSAGEKTLGNEVIFVSDKVLVSEKMRFSLAA